MDDRPGQMSANPDRKISFATTVHHKRSDTTAQNTRQKTALRKDRPASTWRSVGSEVGDSVKGSVGTVDGAGLGLSVVGSSEGLKEGEPVLLLSGEKVGFGVVCIGIDGHDGSAVQLLVSVLHMPQKIKREPYTAPWALASEMTGTYVLSQATPDPADGMRMLRVRA